jgi:hypothetical protein
MYQMHIGEYMFTPKMPMSFNTPRFLNNCRATPNIHHGDGSNFTTSTTDTPLFGHYHHGHFDVNSNNCAEEVEK